MTRVLYWNVERFGIDKIFIEEGPPKKKARTEFGHKYVTSEQADQRLDIILEHIAAFAPDIFVMIEVSTGNGGPGDMATDSGGLSGCETLLSYLAGTFEDDDWRLVPPLRTGTLVGPRAYNEAVAVFFRGTRDDGGRRYFTGPNVWSGGAGGRSQPPTAPGGGPNAHAPYADLDAWFLTLGDAPRTIPGASAHNGGLDETEVAARIRFNVRRTNGTVAQVTLRTQRQPYRCTFCETLPNGNVDREISVIACHPSPGSGWPGAFLNFLARVQDVYTAPAANETKVICGDFNKNLLHEDGSDAQVYQALTALGYRAALQHPGQAAPTGAAALAAYKGYFATHIKPKPDRSQRTKASRFLWSDDDPGAGPSRYPAYNYIGSDRYRNFYSIDNILVRSGAGTGPASVTIANTVTGAPLTANGAPPAGAPAGQLAIDSQFDYHPWPSTPDAPDYAIGYVGTICGWDNYGKVRSTSDHLALFAVV